LSDQSGLTELVCYYSICPSRLAPGQTWALTYRTFNFQRTRRAAISSACNQLSDNELSAVGLNAHV